MMRAALFTATAGLLAAVGCTASKDSSSEGSGSAGGSASGVPVADAGQNQTIPFEGEVVLDGSGSYDPDGDALTYSWSFDSLPDGSALGEGLPSPNNSGEAVRPSFAPDTIGTYVLGLTVSDGTQTSAPDYVVITIEEPETLPVADAGADQSVPVGATVTLDGSRSYDPDGLTLSYAWSVVQAPEGSAVSTDTLSGGDGAAPSFTADAKGAYILDLVVSNGLASSAPDAVNVTTTGADGVPTANAGADIAGYDCTTIQLDASASADPDGDALSYYWEVQSVPAGSSVTGDDLSDPSAPDPTLYADIAGTYELSVTVYDGTSWSVPDTVRLELAERTYNSPPVISIAPYPTLSGGEVTCEESGYSYDCEQCGDQVITNLGDYVTITDADNDPYTVHWGLSVGNGTISDPTDVNTTIILEDIEASEPDVCDTNEFDVVLTATDCTGASGNGAIAILRVECCGVLAEDTGTGK